MLGTLTLPAGTSIKFSPESFKFGQKMAFVTRRAVIYAAVAETAPEMDRRRSKRPAETLYEVLRVKQDASPREIKTAYRALAKLYHPDVSASSVSAAEAALEALDGKEFIEIHEAYATLSDPAERARYDMALGVNSRARRRPMMRHQSSPSDVRAQAGYYANRRWETDQCW